MTRVGVPKTKQKRKAKEMKRIKPKNKNHVLLCLSFFLYVCIACLSVRIISCAFA